MSPSAVPSSASHGHFQSDLNLSLRGLGVEYPPFLLGPEALDTLANRFYPPSAAYGYNSLLSFPQDVVQVDLSLSPD